MRPTRSLGFEGLRLETQDFRDLHASMAFVHDQTVASQGFRVLTLIDVFSRECAALGAQWRVRGGDLATVLTVVMADRDRPAVIQCDQGTEFTSLALDAWAYKEHIRLDYSRRGTPGDNAVNEAFNGSLRRECLSQHHFSSLADAQQILTAWRNEYNNDRPHSDFHDFAPAHFRSERGCPSEPIEPLFQP